MSVQAKLCRFMGGCSAHPPSGTPSQMGTSTWVATPGANWTLQIAASMPLPATALPLYAPGFAP